ncbi:PAS domain-containing protein [Zooshikella sp. RANM57]|uniref:PAS domain-containing protein n=1 Tax=Zooshikella sp. RANM57 TaxID=3425863 RepID=UPI003D6F4474
MNAKQLSFLIDQLDESVVVVDKNLNIVCFNKSAEICFQYQHEEVIGKHLNILIPLKFHESHNQRAKQYIENNEPPRPIDKRESVVYAKKKDGYEFLVRIAILNLCVNGQQHAIAIIKQYEDVIY